MKPKNSERDGRKAPKPLPVAAPAPVPPLFRKIDWLALAITFGVVWTVYLLTLAPELTLEDSGELVTGAFYAGIPHPPGYPVWSIYSWLWTALLPIGNMAWRVSVGQAFSGAMACGLLALMVSRGSSMFMEGIEELKGMTGKWESAICLVSALAAGLLLGLDGFMWKESVVVNRIAVTSVPWFLAVLVCLLRWIYAPHQLRYAYWAAFLFGVCITLHQSLIVAALGIEVAMAAGNPKLGRDAFLGNFIVYLADYLILVLTGDHMFHNIGAKPGLLFLFNAIGMGFAGRQHLAGHPDQEPGDLLEAGADHGRALGAGGFVLPLHGGFGHDQSADAVGLPPHGGRVLPCPQPRPVRTAQPDQPDHGAGPVPEPVGHARSKAPPTSSPGCTCLSRWCPSCSSSRCRSASAPGSSP